ncbi:hypothetical protein D9758_012514 [Tetrapyrgos nigripes]|uniref:Uncharacterized protein n=1 Tax=Tetrapyrgos nigripes TaxID=182062 RepID=A0A8H5G389_9AGAR|nr:hypothetical protein D9758_012514 [Tetrapyrgos nigripes]
MDLVDYGDIASACLQSLTFYGASIYPTGIIFLCALQKTNWESSQLHSQGVSQPIEFAACPTVSEISTGLPRTTVGESRVTVTSYAPSKICTVTDAIEARHAPFAPRAYSIWDRFEANIPYGACPGPSKNPSFKFKIFPSSKYASPSADYQNVDIVKDSSVNPAPSGDSLHPSRASSVHTVTHPQPLTSEEGRVVYSGQSQHEDTEQGHRTSTEQDRVLTSPSAGHDSRRRNAEQRAATFPTDKLIKHVEPSRVFCSLCAKWVQLRQDSSYCAYPWLQHRGKCLARHQRRAEKAAESTVQRNTPRSQPRLSSSYPPIDNLGPSTSHHSLPTRPHARPDPSREEHFRRPYAHRPYSPPPHLEHGKPSSSRRSSFSYALPPIPQRYDFESDTETMMDGHHRYYSRELQTEDYEDRRQRHAHVSASRRSLQQSRGPATVDDDLDYRDEEVDTEGEANSAGSDEEHERERDLGPARPRRPGGYSISRCHGEPDYHYTREHRLRASGRHQAPHYSTGQHGPEASRQTTSHPGPSGHDRRRAASSRSAGGALMDLDSPRGSSIAYLFTTTYEVTDDLSISTLLTYLNSAMPPDKYEDFDTSEVRAVVSLKDKGKTVFEGDLIKRVPGSLFRKWFLFFMPL